MKVQIEIQLLKMQPILLANQNDKLRFFQVVYNGKLRIKNQDYVMKKGNFPSTKRVLEIGKVFVTEKIVNPVKDTTKKIAYEKIDFYSQNKGKIIQLVKNKIKHSNPLVQKEKKVRGKPQHQKKWDVFICHAGEDKNKVARPLAKKLRSEGLKVWYDEFELVWGNSLMKSIDNGLKNSQYGIVILSPSFFKKPWPQKELSGLNSLSISHDEEKILPLLCDLTHKQLTEFSPLLSDLLYKTWDEGPDKIAKAVKRLLKKRG